MTRYSVHVEQLEPISDGAIVAAHLLGSLAARRGVARVTITGEELGEFAGCVLEARALGLRTEEDPLFERTAEYEARLGAILLWARSVGLRVGERRSSSRARGARPS